MLDFDFAGALARISPYIRTTPLHVPEEGLYLKAESQQVTGSFKVRGALNKILKSRKQAVEAGVLAASAGNHGLAVAFAARLVGADCTIVVPEGAVQRKVEGIIGLGAKVQFAPGGYGEAERVALEMGSESSRLWISPYNDADVVEGQGTIALELVRAMSGIEDATILIPVGGGLACGVGLALKKLRPGWRRIGVQAAAAPYMREHFAGRDVGAIVERKTAADGIAGPIQKGSITLEWIRDALDEIEVVEEQEILSAMRWVYAQGGEIVEPSAAVVGAAYTRSTYEGGSAVLLLSGGNVDRDLWESLRGRWSSG